MKTESQLSWRLRPLTLTLLAISTVVLPVVPVDAGTLVIPAWSFARGNAQIHADPDKYADAGPVVVSGPRQPWGWSVEYDVDLPVDGRYTLQIRYATADARPVQVFFDTRDIAKCCTAISLTSASSAKPNIPTSKSSGARWQTLRNRFGAPASLASVRNGNAKAGKHTLVLTSRGLLPHLVTLRLETAAPFPEDWKPPVYKVRDIESVPAKYRKALTSPSNVDVASLRAPVKPERQGRSAATLEIPAWTFNRGNAVIYASPDKYADNGPVVGSEAGQGAAGVVEYDIDFPVDAEYTLHVSYAAADARPVEVFLDDKSMGMCCVGVGFGSAPHEQPVIFTSNSSGAPKRWEGFCKDGKLVKMSIAKGKHTLKFSRSGPLPSLITLRLGSSAGFPKGWKQPPRKMPHFDKVPIRQRSVFLPPDAVNIGALRIAIQDMIKTFGPRYPAGEQYLKRLEELDKKPHTVSSRSGGRGASSFRTWAGEEGEPGGESPTEGALAALRREAMLAHPALKFDKLLFVKKKPVGGHIYEDHHQKQTTSSLCILSPVSPEGKITSLAGELGAGVFSRFDLAFDAKKVVFGYRKKDQGFRIYEVGIDGQGLRQLSFIDDATAKAARNCRSSGHSRAIFHDTDPVYLPNGKILFVSTRSMQNVFCFPATVTNLYVMDADGKNVRRLSSSPLTEMGPSLLDDGRIAYTRWEYVDKGLGNGQALWAVRPDGSGVDHVYKNSILRPSGMLHPRSVPGSRSFVTVGNPHCGRAGGPVIMVDTRTTRRSPEAMTCITPEIGYPCMYTSRWDMGYFLEPHPFSDKFFLVSHIPGAKPGAKPKGKEKKKPARYGIYALDKWGNRAKIYGDPEISCFQPTPLRPRRKPTNIASSETGSATKEKPGMVFIQDVYEGMTGIERGRAKYVRVMGALPWPWAENGVFRIGLAGNVHRKKVYGVAKVHEDGSAYFTVSPRENIFFQVLDENYMQLQHMPTFINVMSGENRSCIGCHEKRRKAPAIAGARPQAMNAPAQALAPQPGDAGPRMVHYESDVQTVLDKHCVGCHSGSSPKGRLDLTGEPTETWNRSYENIYGRGLVSVRHCGFGRSGFRPLPPLSFGSHLSKLAAQIRKAPCKGKITQAEFVRIVTWIDANTPYYGTYRGKRGISDKDHPDFRLPPLVAK
ncbi:MAG: hypothetical protein QGH60_09995 [Phycisphaerae bacterium]|jgi:hypothetical protein|nr:hypothetical protein [Phycisphaerae bacterium]